MNATNVPNAGTTTADDTETTVETVVIGGGQAGLALGYFLKARGNSFVILDAHNRVGDAWRTRWDSLRLFTPAKFNGMPGLPIPGDRLDFTAKDALADFLESYAERCELPIATGVHVDAVRRDGEHFVVTSGPRQWNTANVVVATGGCQTPKVPTFATDISTSVTQLHSSDYRSPNQLADGPVLVVGLGNSGAELALEASRAHPTIVAASKPVELPFTHNRRSARYLLPIVRFLGTHLLTVRTPVGRKLSEHGTTPLIRTRSSNLIDAGVRMVPRIVGVEKGMPVTEDGETLDVANVIWCTGYRNDFSWIDAPAFDESGEPVQDRGVALNVPGLYFIGQEFLYAIVSATLPGIGRDAKYLAKAIVRRRSESRVTGRTSVSGERRVERVGLGD